MAEFMYADRIPAEILAWGNELAQIRRDIHQHPELGFDTSRTCGVIATKLSEWGVEFDDKLVEGGVIAVVNGNAPGPTVALRADMDALAMPDESENAWRSETSQRCHACGHDGHVTWLLGALRALHAHPDFPGRVLAVFQPAEEIGRGARSVVAAGVLEKYKPLEIYGAHASPVFPKGQIGIQAGPVQASCDFFYITLKGRGAHAARPHTTLDPIPTAALLSESLQTIVSRKVNPIEPAVLSICAVQAGNLRAPNVIPNELQLSGTIRTFNPEVRALIETEMRRMTEHIALAQGLGHEVRIDHLTPPLINSPVCADRLFVPMRRSVSLSVFSDRDAPSPCRCRWPGKTSPNMPIEFPAFRLISAWPMKPIRLPFTTRSSTSMTRFCRWPSASSQKLPAADSPS